MDRRQWESIMRGLGMLQQGFQIGDQRRRQDEALKYERTRQAELDRQREEDQLMQLAQYVKDPAAVLGTLFQRRGLPVPQFRNPQEEAANHALAGTLRQNAFDYQNPGALLQGADTLERGGQLQARPPAQIGLPGVGLPGGGAIPFSLPGADPLQALMQSAGRPLADVRDERNHAQARERQRAEEAKALALEEKRQQGRQALAQWKAAADAGNKDAQRRYQYASLYLSSMGDPALLQEFVDQQVTPAGPAYDTGPITAPQVGGRGILGPPNPNFFPQGTKAQFDARIKEQNAETSRYRAEGYVQGVRDRNDLARNWQNIQKGLGEARNALARERNEITRRGQDLTRKTAEERLQFQREQDAWKRDVANANLALKTAADAEPNKAIRDQYQSLLRRGQTLERQANEALSRMPPDNATYERLRQGSADIFRQAEELLATYKAPSGPATAPTRAEGGDAQRSTRLKYVQEFRTRHKREPTPKEVNDIADAVRRGLLR